MVGRCLPKATATGRPTYPRPTTATVASLGSAFTSVWGALRSSTSMTCSISSAMRYLPFLHDRRKIVRVPIDGLLQSSHDPNRRAVAEEPLGLARIGAREHEVALARLAMHRFDAARFGEAARDLGPDEGVEIVERGLVAERDVVGLAERERILDGRGEQVRLHHVVDVAEITRGGAVAI